MSVLIKGMEMPKDGELLCVNIYPDGKVCINLDLECKRIATAVPVPPHGRLVDADTYKKLLADDSKLWILEHTPTVIEAEDDE